MSEVRDASRSEGSIAVFEPLVLELDRLDASDLPRVGGKGANLGELAGAGFRVPPGFCVTTRAFSLFMEACPETGALFEKLDALEPEELQTVRELGARVRNRLSELEIPRVVREAVVAAWQTLGNDDAYAVRSSATAEDLPGASFAGQQDTFLNVIGEEALLDRVKACWISLYTDRAILYRSRNGFGHRGIRLSVIVQRMINSKVSGILFTADPLSGNRNIASIDAGFGLGEALVSGFISADNYKVDKRRLELLHVSVGDKRLAIQSREGGGTTQEALDEEQARQQVLSKEKILELAAIAIRVESHFGCPQDIEWCADGEDFFIVQSRPITTLYPAPPEWSEDPGLRLYICFNHVQVMTDPMPPMAISVWRTLFPFGKRDKRSLAPPIFEDARSEPQIANDGGSSLSKEGLAQPSPLMPSIGGRLYLDMTPLARRNLPRKVLPKILESIDSLMARSVGEVLGRQRFRAGSSRGRVPITTILRWLGPIALRMWRRILFGQPENAQRELETLIENIQEGNRAELGSAEAGAERMRMAITILSEVAQRYVVRFIPYFSSAFASRMFLRRFFSRHADPADLTAIERALHGNITTEMDQSVGDLADVARAHPAVAARFLELGPQALEALDELPGGTEFTSAFKKFLDRFGMRGPSEIDISRPRWKDDPASLLQVIIANLRGQEAGEHRTRFRALEQAADEAAERVVESVRRKAGPLRAAIARRLIRLLRWQLGLREHGKFIMIRFLDLLRSELLDAAKTLQARGFIDEQSDIWFLDLHEVAVALEPASGPSRGPNGASPPHRQPEAARKSLRSRIKHRRQELEQYRKLSPPRVLTSDGESPVSQHQMESIPEGALPGSPASAGVVEGVARVVLDPSKEVLHKGEILVAPFTDPGWTPLFINATGLVMEVGGLMTHGSVVAREYGIPAVVNVPNATRTIRTGQRIRVNGDRGFVEGVENQILEELKNA